MLSLGAYRHSRSTLTPDQNHWRAAYWKPWPFPCLRNKRAFTCASQPPLAVARRWTLAKSPTSVKSTRGGSASREADAPCFQRVVSLFLSVICFWRNYSKSLIPHGDCPFVLNRLPVFLENLPVSGRKTGRRVCGLCWRRRSTRPTAEAELPVICVETRRERWTTIATAAQLSNPIRLKRLAGFRRRLFGNRGVRFDWRASTGGTERALEGKVNEADLLNMRLSPDMFNLARQVRPYRSAARRPAAYSSPPRSFRKCLWSNSNAPQSYLHWRTTDAR